MRLRPVFCSAALFIVFIGTHVNADEPASTPPQIWRLEDTAQIGGHTATVSGAPKVVDLAGSKAVYFDGVGDGLLLPVNPLEGLATFTIEVLFYPASEGQEEQRFLHAQDTLGSRALLETRLKDGRWALDSYLRSEKSQDNRALLDRTKLHPADRWTWVSLVYANGRMAQFVNGVLELEGAMNFPPMGPGQISLGVRQNKVFWFKGGIREVRFHAAALTPGALQRIPDAK